MTSARQILSYLHGRQRFNHRVAGVAIRDGHVLVCREDADDFVLLPGGRVEMGEASDVALQREIEEELGCVGQVGRLLFSVENFFFRDDEQFHEIGLYYALALPDEFPFETDRVTLVTYDEGHELSFFWVPIVGDGLARINLLPLWLRARFGDLPLTSQHLIIDERLLTGQS